MAQMRSWRVAIAAAGVLMMGLAAQNGSAAVMPRTLAGAAIRGPAGPRPGQTVAGASALRRQVPLTLAADEIRHAVAAGAVTGGYAGIGLRAGLVTVWWKGRLPARVAAAIRRARRVASVVVRPAAYSAAELLAASRRLWTVAGLTHGGPLIGIRMPFDGSGLAALVARGKATARPDVLADLSRARIGVPVRVLATAPAAWASSRCTDSTPWWGGGAIYNSTLGGPGAQCEGNASLPYFCTAGFAVTYGGSQYLTTAGHCGNVNDQFSNPAGLVIGPVAFRDPAKDIELIKAPAGGQVWDAMAGSPDFARPVTGWEWPSSGESLCFSGTTSGPGVCGGTVDSQYTNYCGTDSRGNVQCFANLVSMMGQGDVCALKGDSGGAVFKLDSTSTKAVAVGSVSGVLSQPSEGGTTQCWTLFQTIGNASNDWPGLNVVTGSSALYAPSVSVLESNTKNCPGSQEYFSATDYSGVAIDWTYANGSYQCVQVTYYPVETSATCTYSFYVPNGDATGKINFRITYLVNGNPRSVTDQLDENPITGFTTIYTGSNVIAIGFGDNNGSQTYPVKLGWGVGPDHSLEQTC